MRRRAQLADLVYPGGLTRFQPVLAGGDASASGGDIALRRLARRTAESPQILTQDGRLITELTSRAAHLRPDVEARLEGAQREIWDASPELSRSWLVITLGLFYDVPGIAEATGLRRDMPPADVHAMSHVPWATGGDLGYADAIDRVLAKAGVPIGTGTSVLDFGSSSGRVVRVLAAAHPQARFFGCDPNEPAITWAQEHLPEVSFHVSPQRPPLELEDGSLDAAYAISIWSHFAAEPGLAWFAEMARLIRPGGALVFSTHGDQSIAIRAGRGEQWGGHLVRAANEMYTEGFSFFDPFGPEGDWGVVDAEWGMAFATAEWLMTRLQADWTLDQLYPGGIEHDQDVYVLRRRPSA